MILKMRLNRSLKKLKKEFDINKNNSKPMKKLLFPIICVAVFTIGCGSEEKTVNEKTEDAKEQRSIKQSTLEELGASIILALKANDSTLLSDLLPEKEDVEQLMIVYAGGENEKKNIVDASEENTDKIRDNTYKAFSKIREKGNKTGIKWEEVIFSNAEYTTKKENNIETTDLKIFFSFKDKKYTIHIAECIKTKRGWLIFDKPQWSKINPL